MLGAKNNVPPLKVANMPLPVSPASKPAPLRPMQLLHDALADNDLLRAEVSRLQNDLEVERRHCQELEHQLDRENKIRSRFERYSVELNIHLDNISTAIKIARERANTMALDNKQEEQANAGGEAQAHNQGGGLRLPKTAGD